MDFRSAQDMDKMEFCGQIFAQATVGEAISLPPRWDNCVFG